MFFQVCFIIFVVISYVFSNPLVKSVNLNILAGKKIPNKHYDPLDISWSPSRVDWAGVISGCKASFRYEKRLCNFYIRAAAHDALSVRENFGGADGSLLLTDDELRRPENKHDLFAYTVSKNALKLSKMYRASVADVLAVCAGAAVEFLGGPEIVKYNNTTPFMVGRIDLHSPNPGNALAKADINLTEFEEFATNRKLSMEEMTALMGTHSLIDSKGCLNVDGETYCNPLIENCNNISMFKWSNSYYNDVCNMNTTLYKPAKEIEINIDNDFEYKKELCKYTSKTFKDEASIDFTEAPETTDIIKITVEFIENSIMKIWNYTVNDAWLGKSCRGEFTNSPKQKEISQSMNRFKNSHNDWNEVYSRAYKKMVSIGADWSNFGGYPITGYECNSGYVSKIRGIRCNNCNINFRMMPRSNFLNCHTSCICRTSFKPEDIFSSWTE
jgi:hypothetical protein